MGEKWLTGWLWIGVVFGVGTLAVGVSELALADEPVLEEEDGCKWEDLAPGLGYSCLDPGVPNDLCGTILADNSNWIGGCEAKCTVKLDVLAWSAADARVEVHESVTAPPPNPPTWFPIDTMH